MRGPEHYDEAERLLTLLPPPDGARSTETGLTRQETYDEAGVHATLALTAAVALFATEMPGDGQTAYQWRRRIAERSDGRKG